MSIGAVLDEAWTLFTRFFFRFYLVALVVFAAINLVYALVGSTVAQAVVAPFSAIAVAMASVFVFGLTPALRASRASLTSVLRAAGSGVAARTGWGRGALVTVQVALSVVFIAVTAFIYSSFLEIAAVGPGVRTDGVLTMSFNTELSRYGPEEAERFYEQLADRARGVAGVERVSLASFVPFSGFPVARAPIAPEGYEFAPGIESEAVLTSYVDTGYFELMDVPLLEGRSFSATDTAEAPRVAVVNRAFAERFWPGESPLGRRFRAGGAESAWVEIVGVVPTLPNFTITDPPLGFVYIPYEQAPQTRMALVARTNGDALSLAEPLRAVVRELDPELAVASVRTTSNGPDERGPAQIIASADPSGGSGGSGSSGSSGCSGRSGRSAASPRASSIAWRTWANCCVASRTCCATSRAADCARRAASRGLSRGVS